MVLSAATVGDGHSSKLAANMRSGLQLTKSYTGSGRHSCKEAGHAPDIAHRQIATQVSS